MSDDTIKGTSDLKSPKGITDFLNKIKASMESLPLTEKQELSFKEIEALNQMYLKEVDDLINQYVESLATGIMISRMMLQKSLLKAKATRDADLKKGYAKLTREDNIVSFPINKESN